MTGSFATEREALKAGLHEAARRERAARRPRALRCAFGAATAAAAMTGVCMALFALGSHLVAADEARIALPWLFVAPLCMAALAAFAVTLRELRRDQALLRVAARMDQAPGARGCVLPAFELSLGEAADGFAALAIMEGVATLRQPCVVVVDRGLMPSRWRTFLLVALCSLVAAGLMPPRTPREPELKVPGFTAERRTLPGSTTNAAAARPETPPAPTAGTERGTSAAGERGGTQGSADASVAPSVRPAAAEAGRGRSAATERAGASGASKGDATPGGAPPDARDPAKNAAKPPKAAAPTRAQRARESEDQRSGATRGASGSGGGSIAAVKSAWQQRDPGSDEALSPNETGDRIEEDPDEEEARAGTQPGLKDRRQTASRDLSISGPGAGGDGRGGPSLPKKARGTGSMVLGVPVPDFVRGLLNPGTTRITHERVTPTRRASAALAVTDTAAREGLAPMVQRARIPRAWSAMLEALQQARRRVGG